MDKSLRDTFALALLIGLALGVLSGSILFWMSHPYSRFIVYIGILQWVRFAVNPSLMFTVFYFHGRKLDLKAKLRSVIVLLFLGLYVGYFLGYMIYPVFTTTPYQAALFFCLYPLTLICPFFVALSASAIAYIRNIKTSIEGQNKKEKEK